MSTKTPFVIGKVSPTVFTVSFGGEIKGKLGGNKEKGYRYFGDPDNKFYPTQEKAATALLTSLKLLEAQKTAKTKKTTTPEGETPALKVNDKVVFETKCRTWLEANYAEQVNAYLPEFTKTLFSLRTRKKFLKEVKDLELAQAMLDFERDNGNRKRQVKYLLAKVNGLARGTANKKLTPAQQVAALFTDCDFAGTETAPEGEQPKQLTVKFRREDGSLVTVLLTVREVVEEEPTEDGDDDDDDDSSEDAADGKGSDTPATE